MVYSKVPGAKADTEDVQNVLERTLPGCIYCVNAALKEKRVTDMYAGVIRCDHLCDAPECNLGETVVPQVNHSALVYAATSMSSVLRVISWLSWTE